MTKDFLVFIHGVYTRGNLRTISYADRLFESVEKIVRRKNPALSLVKIPLYWGDLNEEEEERLKRAYRSSPDWPKFWFRTFRETTLLQFIGDAALYVSRDTGARIMGRLNQQMREGLQPFEPDDRLHIIGHSFGALILFDMLFATRWDEPDHPGYEPILGIRELLYGMEPGEREGFLLSSIHTFGAPIGLFSLIDVPSENGNGRKNSHSITPRLRKLLRRLREERDRYSISWFNYAHVADPLAYPLKPLIEDIAGEEGKYLSIEDVTDIGMNWLDLVTGPFRQSPLSLINVGNAHNSYWYSLKVAEKMADAIIAAAANRPAAQEKKRRRRSPRLSVMKSRTPEGNELS